MEISLDKGLVFVCVPKCASTSIGHAIASDCDIHFSGPDRFKHLPYRQFVKLGLPSIFRGEKFTSFCVMREPIDWCFSWYRYRSRDEAKELGPDRYTGDMTFDEFMCQVMDASVSRRPKLLGRQKYYFLMPDGSVGVDRIFDFRRLDILRDFLSETLGKEVCFSHLNASPEGDFKLSDGTRSRLSEYLSGEICFYSRIQKNGVYRREVDGSAFR